MLIDSLRHNLAGLARFSGRSSRAQFWPWAATLFGLAMVATWAMMMPWLVESMARIQRFAKEHPDQATVSSGPGHYSIRIEGDHPELFPDIAGFMGSMGWISIAMVLLLAAAVVRRLHDRGRTGWWGGTPLPFLAAGLVMMPRLIAPADRPDFSLFSALVLNNFVYLGLLLTLIVMLAGSGEKGENRYGEEPR